MYMDYGRVNLISEKLSKALNVQINKEFYSAYLYLSMVSYFASVGLYGFANWLQIQAKEEVEHGLIIFNYLIEHNSEMEFNQINPPEFSFVGYTETFDYILQHEKMVTVSIYNLVSMASEENDELTKNFLDYFVKEQFEEETQVKEIIARLNLFKDSKCALYSLDSDLGKREYKKHF